MAKVGAEDSVGFPQQALDLIPEPRERLGSAFEGERLDLVSEKVQPFRDCRAPSLQLGANLLRPGDHAPLGSRHHRRPQARTATFQRSGSLRRPFLRPRLPPELLRNRPDHKSMTAISFITQ